MIGVHKFIGSALIGAAMVVSATAAVAEDKALKAAVEGAWRPADSKARDAYRHPVQSLTFWGLKPGMTVVEVEPGGKGWWVEIIAPYAKATGGSYIAALPDRENARTAFAAEITDKAIYGEPKSYPFSPTNTTAIPAGSADMVLVARAFHNWSRQGEMTDTYLKAFNTVLKKGGILAVEQHRAPEGSDPKAGTGYVPESYVIDAAKKAGFELVAKSEINANPKDTKDHPYGVWTLPPVRRVPKADDAAAASFDRAKYDAIGESDRMTLKFKKVK